MSNVPGSSLRPLVRAWIVVVALIAVPGTAAAQSVDCQRAPTFMRKIPGGQEIAFHPECEPPAVRATPGKAAARLAPVSGPSADAVPVAGTVATAAANAARANDTTAASAASPSDSERKRVSGPQGSTKPRVQAYMRVRRR